MKKKISLESLVLLAFVSAALIATTRFSVPSHLSLINGTEDGFQSAWLLWVFDHNLFHLQNPLFSSQVNAPFGVNIADSGTDVLGALLVSPFELLGQPYLAANIALVLTIFLNGYLGYVVLRRLKFSRPIATASGLYVLLSPYFYFHSLSHLMVTSVYGLWLVLLFGIRLLDYKHIQLQSRWGIQIAFGVALTLNAYTFQYNAVYSVIILVLIILNNVFHQPQATLRYLRFSFIRLIVPGMIAVILYLPYGLYGMIGPQSVHTTYPGSTTYVMDLLSFISPPTWLAGYNKLLLPGTVTYSWNTGEWEGFLGIIGFCIGLSFLLMKETWSNSEKRVWAVLSVLFMAMSLGPTLHVNGSITGVPLPDLLFQKIPLLSQMREPSRFFGPGLIAWSVCIAYGLHKLELRLRKTSGLLSLLLILELIPVPQQTYSARSLPPPALSKPIGHSVMVPFGLQDGAIRVGNGDLRDVFSFAFDNPDASIMGGDITKIPPPIEEYLMRQRLLHFLGNENVQSNLSSASFQVFADLFHINNLYYVKNDSSPAVSSYLNSLQRDGLIVPYNETATIKLYMVKCVPFGQLRTNTASAETDPILYTGWSGLEGNGKSSWVWSDGASSTLMLPPLRNDGLYQLIITGLPFTPIIQRGGLQITAYYNGKRLATHFIQKTGLDVMRITFKYDHQVEENPQILLKYSATLSPQEVGLGGDTRQLAFAVKSIEVVP